jgi:hypothetical protein
MYLLRLYGGYVKIKVEQLETGHYCAVDDNTYDGPGSIIGCGFNEQAAIDDLLLQKREKWAGKDLSDHDLKDIAELGLQAFWEAVKDNLVAATTGDLSPFLVVALEEAAFKAVKEWYNSNCVKDYL